MPPGDNKMKPPPFSYHDPETVADVIGLLGSRENARPLAGGQSLMPMLNTLDAARRVRTAKEHQP